MVSFIFKVFDEKKNTKQKSRPKFFGILRSVAEGKQTYFFFGLRYIKHLEATLLFHNHSYCHTMQQCSVRYWTSAFIVIMKVTKVMNNE